MPRDDDKPNGTTRCPLCHEPNQCGVAAGATSCWCFRTTVPQSLVDEIPEVLRGVVCVCQNCIQAHIAAQTPAPVEPGDESAPA